MMLIKSMTAYQFIFMLVFILLSACGDDNDSTAPSLGVDVQTLDCSGDCAQPDSFLSVSDVERIIAQTVAEASAQNISATIAVVDRVGHVLAVFRMNSADTEITVASGRNTATGLDGLTYIPDTLVAISKAITAAYLSSEGNAFSTRTASQIVQQNFNPGERDQPGGPLFGVQFSNLPCSDLNTRYAGTINAGPKRSPLGLSADTGGLPLYKRGTPVGGIGVISDGIYGLDQNALDIDRDSDELLAFAGSFGFAAPLDRRANRITVDGKSLRFSDIDFGDLASDPQTAATFTDINGVLGNLQAVTGYSIASIVAGTAFGQAASGIRADDTDYPGLDAFVLVDNADNNRYPPVAASDGGLTLSEVRALMQHALETANRTRAQIRRPLGSQARVSIAIVDTNGAVLALARSRDAPVFGTDVALQKARTAAFFSNANAATDLSAAPNAVYLDANTPLASGVEIVISDYVTAAQTFLGSPTALTDGAYAFADRSGGNLSRPYYPDGLIGSTHGPFSKPFPQWSPFSTGLQLDLSLNKIVQHILFTQGIGTDAPANCTTLMRLPNGIQIFPGSVPIYKGNSLVGGIGVSGDGVDQDDMIAFLGLHYAGQTLTTINNAALNMRADQLSPRGVRLRFVQCPQAPFLNSLEQNVCADK